MPLLFFFYYYKIFISSVNLICMHNESKQYNVPSSILFNLATLSSLLFCTLSFPIQKLLIDQKKKKKNRTITVIEVHNF